MQHLCSAKFLISLLALGALAAASSEDDDDYHHFETGAWSCTKLTLLRLFRAKLIDNSLNIFIDFAGQKGETLRYAAAVDWKRQQGLPVGELACRSIGIKDNIDVKEFPTTAGTPFLSLPPYEPTSSATAIQTLLDEGAIPDPKEIPDEMAGDVTGQNFFTGFVNNPIAPLTVNGSTVYRISGGSSAGSAVAATKRMGVFRIGTDTGGSIRIPAAFTETFGFRPNSTNTTDDGYPVGTGVVRVSSTLDRVGVLSKRARWVAKAHQVITGNYDPILPAYLPNIRLGYDPDEINQLIDPDVKAVFEAALCELESAGVTIVEVPLTGILNTSSASNFLVGPFEGNNTLPLYAGIGSNLPTLVSQIVTPSVQFFFGQFIIGPLRPTEAQYQTGLFLRTVVRGQIENVTNDFDLDAILWPTVGIAPPPQPVGPVVVVAGQPVSTFEYFSRFTNVGSAAALASGSVPIGRVASGAPVGMLIDGLDNRKVISLMRAVDGMF